MSFSEYTLLENSSKNIIDTYKELKFSDVREFLDFCSFKPFDYEEIKTIKKDTIPLSLSWLDDDIVFEDLFDYPDDDREEVLIFVINELEDFFKNNNTYFDNGQNFVHLEFVSNQIWGGFYYNNPLKFKKLEIENKTFERYLKKTIEYINDQILMIYDAPMLHISKVKNFGKDLDKLQQDYNLEENSTLLDYKIEWIKEYLRLSQGHIEIPTPVFNSMVTKLSMGFFTYSDIKNKPMSQEALDFIEHFEKIEKQFKKDYKIKCVVVLEDIIINAVKEFLKELKYIYNDHKKEIINNIDELLKDKESTGLTLLIKLKDLLDKIDNIGGYDKLLFNDNKFIINGQLYKKLNFINNNIQFINKLK